LIIDGRMVVGICRAKDFGREQDFIHFRCISLTFDFAFGDFEILLQNFVVLRPFQNFEILVSAMAKVKKINIAAT
jgi:hypothetical protein